MAGDETGGNGTSEKERVRRKGEEGRDGMGLDRRGSSGIGNGMEER